MSLTLDEALRRVTLKKIDPKCPYTVPIFKIAQSDGRSLEIPIVFSIPQVLSTGSTTGLLVVPAIKSFFQVSVQDGAEGSLATVTGAGETRKIVVYQISLTTDLWGVNIYIDGELADTWNHDVANQNYTPSGGDAMYETGIGAGGFSAWIIYVRYPFKKSFEIKIRVYTGVGTPLQFDGRIIAAVVQAP